MDVMADTMTAAKHSYLATGRGYCAVRVKGRRRHKGEEPMVKKGGGGYRVNHINSFVYNVIRKI